jgi:SAM-dependent methyltransferase
VTGLIALNDVEAQAREGWRIGAELCTQCDAYHQAWGILRLAKVMRGISNDEALLTPIIDELVAPGGQVFIAGSADAGLLQLVVNASRARPIAVTVADRCPSPIALIDRIGVPADVSVDAQVADLTALDEHDRYDLILSHSMLPFVDDATRVAILRRFRASLREGGRLLLVVRTAPLAPENIRKEHSEAWLAQALRKLEARPDLVAFCGDTLHDRVARNAGSRARRAYAFIETSEISDMLARGGFLVERQLLSRESGAVEVLGERIAKQGHIFVARPA